MVSVWPPLLASGPKRVSATSRFGGPGGSVLQDGAASSSLRPFVDSIGFVDVPPQLLPALRATSVFTATVERGLLPKFW